MTVQERFAVLLAEAMCPEDIPWIRAHLYRYKRWIARDRPVAIAICTTVELMFARVTTERFEKKKFKLLSAVLHGSGDVVDAAVKVESSDGTGFVVYTKGRTGTVYRRGHPIVTVQFCDSAESQVIQTTERERAFG